MSRAYRHPCGCRSTDSAWLELCAACNAEYQERHIQAARDYRERNPSTGIRDDNARVSPPQSFSKAAPTAGGVTVPGASYLEARP